MPKLGIIYRYSEISIPLNRAYGIDILRYDAPEPGTMYRYAQVLLYSPVRIPLHPWYTFYVYGVSLASHMDRHQGVAVPSALP
jgi:hypothetical protein